MTDERWRFLLDYPGEVFGEPDPQLDSLMERAEAAGLPPIAVTKGAGQLLKLLTSMTAGRLALEVGTLAGYSGIWIARGLQSDGKLITIEYSDHHATFAEQEFEKAGLGSNVEVRRGAALEVLPQLADELGPGSVDFVFIDAVKDEYVGYFEAVKDLVANGGIVTADNVYGTGQGWVDESFGADNFNRHVAAAEGFEATTVPVGGGLMIARRT